MILYSQKGILSCQQRRTRSTAPRTERVSARSHISTPFDNATELVVELCHGEGGADSKIFVDELASAYVKYATSKGLKVEKLTEEDGHIILQIRGKGCYQVFKHEGGKHCIQRVPPTEHNDRKQTSMVSVAVLPLPPDDPKEALREKDLEFTYQTGKQKAGGQNVNRVHSAVRAKHLPSGLTVFINGRDQGANKKEAIRILTARVNAMKREAQHDAYTSARTNQMDGGGRGNKIRTYNVLEGRVVDHRLGTRTGNVDGVLKKGKFDLILGEVN